ncbi:hypothetical protein DVA67_020415 [Solirubrobacter sp. CPCC 204708]|uniref:Uncharacterized protein n=1 Tax=Solirubrobacter deserti TaxID=2282478 RepID=A0ABT4RNH6_9ACTN|nr:hypothetical protein [Solirubrobacter deserti]MBE2318357.1 hypothetical protein [Solirubrobacter deserti]MDA0140123.1 hypothetical protein [Solirubrobacter deserti]
MWDLAIVPAESETSLAPLLADASRRARVILIAPPGGRPDVGVPVTVVEVDEARDLGADVAGIAATLGLATLLDGARRPVFVEGLAGEPLTLAAELAVSALRLRGVARVVLREGEAIAAGDTEPARLRTDAPFSAALAAVDDLLASERLIAAERLLAAVAETAFDAGDGLAVALGAPLEQIELARRFRRVPAPELGESAPPPGAVARHALRAAERTGDQARAAALAQLVAATPDEPGEDVAARLIELARERLAAPEFEPDHGGEEHALVVGPGDAGPLLSELAPGHDVLVLGEGGRGVPESAISLTLASSAPATVRGVLAGHVFAGDGVTVLVPGEPGGLERVAVAACLRLHGRVHEVRTVSDGAVRRAAVQSVLERTRESALVTILGRRVGATGDLDALGALAARLPGAAPELDLARELRRGFVGPARLADAGVGAGALELIRRREALSTDARAAAARWPAIRRDLADGVPQAVDALAVLLGPAFALAMRNVRAGGADPTLADVAEALGVGPDEDEDALAAGVEDAVAEALGVDPALFGAADPVVSLLQAAPPARADASSFPDPFEAEDTALAVAEARHAAHPEGLWVLDSALAAIELVEARGLQREARDPDDVVRLAELRAGAALERLRALPEGVLTRGAGILGLIEDAVDTLRTWFAGLPEADALDEWLEGWSRAGLARERTAVALAGDYAPEPARGVLTRAALESGLVEPSARPTLDLTRAGVTGVELALLPTVADALAAAERDDLDGTRAALELRALLPGPRALWAHVLADARIVASAPMTRSPDGKLRASLPAVGHVVVTAGRELRLDARALAAGALLARPGRRVATAEALELIGEVLGAPAERTLLRAAAALLIVAEDEPGGLLLDGVRRRLAAGEAPAARVARELDSVAMQLTVRCAQERAELQRALVRDLERARFHALDAETQRDKLALAQSRLVELEALDRLLA